MISALLAAALAISPAQFEKSHFGSAQKAISAACGTYPPIAISWDAFGQDRGGRDQFTRGGLGFLVMGLKSVCGDATLKSDFKMQISRIVISQAYGATDPMIYVSDRALHIEYLWVKGEAGPDADVVAREIASRLRGEEMEAP